VKSPVNDSLMVPLEYAVCHLPRLHQLCVHASFLWVMCCCHVARWHSIRCANGACILTTRPLMTGSEAHVLWFLCQGSKGAGDNAWLLVFALPQSHVLHRICVALHVSCIASVLQCAASRVCCIAYVLQHKCVAACCIACVYL